MRRKWILAIESPNSSGIGGTLVGSEVRAEAQSMLEVSRKSS